MKVAQTSFNNDVPLSQKFEEVPPQAAGLVAAVPYPMNDIG